jgi:hypothetical protein
MFGIVIALSAAPSSPGSVRRQVNGREQQGDEQLIDEMDAAHQRISALQRGLFRLIAAMDQRETWQGDGAYDMAHWLVMRYGISSWKAYRWIAAAHALEGLPHLAHSFAQGDLTIDKVVELARFATPEIERGLIRWAQEVSCGAIRHRADLAARRGVQDVIDADNDRSLSWSYFDEGRRFALEAELPAAQGAVVARAIERVAETIPPMPGEEPQPFASARRADALVAMCSSRIAADPDQDRATIVVHTRAAGGKEPTGSEIERGPVIHSRTLQRLLCNGRVQTVVESKAGDVIGLGRMSREPSAWMIRQIRYRDRECRFPGCGARRFTQAHHIVWWRNGGRTDLDNLLLICSFHHKLVHEHGWTVKRRKDGTIGWFRPNGVRYRAGPFAKSPPIQLSQAVRNMTASPSLRERSANCVAMG